MRYLTREELIYINGLLLNKVDILSGTRQVRDVLLLDSAVVRPEASAFGQDAYPTLRDKAAALLHAVARNHPFADGNKRTATVAALFFLRINGEHVLWNQADALAMIVRVAEGLASLDAFAAWLTTEPCPPSPEPDAERDMAIIREIVEEQRWLLHELERR
jgi:death-on-curing protein